MKGKEKKKIVVVIVVAVVYNFIFVVFFLFLLCVSFLSHQFSNIGKTKWNNNKIGKCLSHTSPLSFSVETVIYKELPILFFFLSSFLLFYFYYLFLFSFFPFHHFIYHQSINSFHLQLSSNYTMHRTYSLRQNRAPTAAQLQSPAPPPSSTKSGRFFGKGSIGMWKTRHTISIVKINHL